MLEQLKQESIYIYGMGEYGIDISLRLRDIGIQVESFIDANKEKYSRTLYGISCIPLNCVSKTEKTVIIIGLRESNGMLEVLKTAGFEKIYSYQEIRNWVDRDWNEVLDQRLDYSIEELRNFKYILEETGFLEQNSICNGVLQDIYKEIWNQRI